MQTVYNVAGIDVHKKMLAVVIANAHAAAVAVGATEAAPFQVEPPWSHAAVPNPENASFTFARVSSSSQSAR